MIKCLKKFEVDEKITQFRSVELRLEKGGEKHILMAVSENQCLDPWPEGMGFIDHTVSFYLFNQQGERIWKRTFGRGTIPGIWFSPFIAFDLDKDGCDEIYFVHNLRDDLPFSQYNMFADKIDPRTGETIKLYEFPAYNTVLEKMSWSFRYNLSAGYVHGEPVFVMEQGTYTDMYLQCYNSKMEKIWERKIGRDEPGARASHHISVFDYNKDGVDELFYGERIISLETGKDIICFDEMTFKGHSDIVQPFYDENGKLYFYTCRENGSYVGCDRIVTFDKDGNSVWRAVKCEKENQEGMHIHTGSVINVKGEHKKIAYGIGLRPGFNHDLGDVYFFDAYTGEQLNIENAIEIGKCHPLDINGDGYHEFYSQGKFFEFDGTLLADIGEDAVLHKAEKAFDLQGEHCFISRKGGKTIELWGDDEAKDGEIIKKRYENGFLEHMKHLTGAGYNMLPTVTCSM